MTERSVPDGAREWIAQKLEDGMPLTRAFAATIRTGSGSVTALVPDDIRDAPITGFDEGIRELGEIIVRADGLRLERVITAKDELAAHVYDYLQNHEAATFIIAALDASPTSPYLKGLEFPVTSVGDDIYFVLGARTSAETVYHAIKRGSSWNFIAFLGVGSESDLEQAVATSDEVIVGAFDGEGYLVWRRNPPVN